MTLFTRVVLFSYNLQFNLRWNLWAISTNIRTKLWWWCLDRGL